MRVEQAEANHRRLIEWYRESRHSNDSFDEEVLNRLALDQDGKVSAAFFRLRHRPATILIGVVIGAARVAKFGSDIPSAATKAAADFKRLAENARELSLFILDLLPSGIPDLGHRSTPTVKRTLAMMQSVEDLPIIADFLQGIGETAETMPKKLFVTNKHSGESAGQLRAMRLVAQFVRKKPSGRVDHEAIKSLVEVALNVSIAASLAKEAFRNSGSGNRRTQKPPQSTLPHN